MAPLIQLCLPAFFTSLIGCAAVREPPKAEAEPSADAIAFVGVTVVPMTEIGTVLHDQIVLVQGDRIAAVGPADQVRVPERALRIHGNGRYLIPGLVDMHVHLEYFEEPDVLMLILANGVTTVRNMDGRGYILDWRDRIAEGSLPGPAIHTAGPILDGDPPILPDNTVVRTAPEARSAVIEQASRGYNFVKVYTNLSPEAYRAVLDTAEELGLPVAGHVPRGIELADALTGGQVAIEHLGDYGEWIESGDSAFRDEWHWSKLYLAMRVDSAKVVAAAARIAESEMWTVPTIVQADRALAPTETVRRWLTTPEFALIPADGRSWWKKLHERRAARMDAADWEWVRQGRSNRRKLLRALHEAGARLLVGTDTPNPFVVPGFSVIEELEIFVEAGIPPAEALSVATRDAARFFHDLEEWGTIEAGKRADLLLLHADPLEDIGNLRRRVGVMVRGRWLPEAELEMMVSRSSLR